MDGPCSAPAGDGGTARAWEAETGAVVGKPLDGHSAANGPTESVMIAVGVHRNASLVVHVGRIVLISDISSGELVGGWSTDGELVAGMRANGQPLIATRDEN